MPSGLEGAGVPGDLGKQKGSFWGKWKAYHPDNWTALAQSSADDVKKLGYDGWADLAANPDRQVQAALFSVKGGGGSGSGGGGNSLMELGGKLKLTIEHSEQMLGKKMRLSLADSIAPGRFMFDAMATAHARHPRAIHDVAVEDGASRASPELMRELDEFMDFANAAYDDFDADDSMVEFLVRKEFSLLYFDGATDYELAGHFVAFHPGKKQCVIGIKGTSTVSDVLTDILCRSTAFLPGSFAHDGIQMAARRVVARVRCMLENLFVPLEYDIVVTGHSLGAGVAALVAVILREGVQVETVSESAEAEGEGEGEGDVKGRKTEAKNEEDGGKEGGEKGGVKPKKMDRVRAFCFASPPVLDQTMALKCRPYVVSVVNDRDMIPRTSLSNMNIMQETLYKVSEMLKSGEVSATDAKGAKGASSGLGLAPSESEDGGSGSGSDSGSAKADAALAVLREMQEEHKLGFEQDLYAPGRVVYLVGVEGGKMAALEKDGRLTGLRQLLLSKGMVGDHSMDRYLESLRGILFDEYGRHSLSCPPIVAGTSGVHVAVDASRKFYSPADAREVTMYAVRVTALPRAPIVAWRRFTDFETLDDFVSQHATVVLPCKLPNKLLVRSADKRLPLLRTYLDLGVAKVAKKNDAVLMARFADFLGLGAAALAPDFVLAALAPQDAADHV